MTIDIIISTYKNRINRLNNFLFKPKEGINYIIIHQIQQDDERWDSDVYNSNTHVEYYPFKENGLAKSRNRGIQNSKSDIILLVDDDIQLKYENLNKLVECFKHNNHVDIITFQSEQANGNLRKQYRDFKYFHNQKTIAGVSSIEIAFRRSSVMNKQIRFDERFGLGAAFPVSEEYIFLSDCLKNKLKILYVPLALSIHKDNESTGSKYTEELIRAKGAVFQRTLGFFGFAGIIYFSVKHHKAYKQIFTYFAFIRYAFSGLMQYLKSRKMNITRFIFIYL